LVSIERDLSRYMILVSGAPGSGKTTLALPLARTLNFALISKDALKEALFDALNGPADDLEFSRVASDAAMELLWVMAPNCPHVILEANFRPRSGYERDRIEALKGQKVEIYCRCPPEEAARRFALRAGMLGHHPAHALKSLSMEMLAEYDRPVAACPVIEVDTTQPVDIPRLVEKVREHWSDAVVS